MKTVNTLETQFNNLKSHKHNIVEKLNIYLERLYNAMQVLQKATNDENINLYNYNKYKNDYLLEVMSITTNRKCVEENYNELTKIQKKINIIKEKMFLEHIS